MHAPTARITTLSPSLSRLSRKVRRSRDTRWILGQAPAGEHPGTRADGNTITIPLLLSFESKTFEKDATTTEPRHQTSCLFSKAIIPEAMPLVM